VKRLYNNDVHETVETVDDGDEGKILTVLQKGYKFQGGLFRPARVRISKRAGAAPAALEKPSEDAPAI
jgi:molecular chaperone GrpE (heat shock protein)